MASFARFRLPDGRYWVERQVLRQVLSGRDLIKTPVEGKSVKGMIAVGGVDYDGLASLQEKDKDSQASSAVITVANNTTVRNKTEFNELPYSLQEASGVVERYIRFTKEDSLLLSGGDAKEASIKTLQAPPRRETGSC